MGEWIGVLIAIVSSALGGTAAAVTRYLVADADPLTLAILRWGIGFACVLPVALVLRVQWPRARDWPAVALLGICFFGLFFIFYNIAVAYTTAARASLALSTLPLQTMVVGALLRAEALTARKTTGVAIAILGVLAALATGLSAAPPGAWRGELIMTAAVVCMAFYNVLSRPLMQRSSALGFLAVGMGFGAAVLVLAGLAGNRISTLASFAAPQWIAGVYLGVAGGALAFHSLGAGAPARLTDACSQYHDNQSDCGRAARSRTRRRAHHAQPCRRSGRGLLRHLGRDDAAARRAATGGGQRSEITALKYVRDPKNRPMPSWVPVTIFVFGAARIARLHAVEMHYKLRSRNPDYAIDGIA
jgi:drug/metabolite transporter (DMT)-like permease